MNIGTNIRTWRELKNIKQEELARSISVSAATLSNIENNINKPNVDMLELIANALNLEVTKLFSNPQQHFEFNNCSQSIGSGTQNNSFDPKLLEKIVVLLEKISNKI